MNEASQLYTLNGCVKRCLVTRPLWNVRFCGGVFHRGHSHSARTAKTNSGAMSADAHLVQSRWSPSPVAGTLLSASSSCLSATILTCCSAGYASLTTALSVSRAASRCQSPYITSRKRCATKSAKTRPRPPPPDRQAVAQSGGKLSSPSTKTRIKRRIRNCASTTSNQRRGHASVLQGMNTATARACGSRWRRSVFYSTDKVGLKLC